MFTVLIQFDGSCFINYDTYKPPPPHFKHRSHSQQYSRKHFTLLMFLYSYTGSFFQFLKNVHVSNKCYFAFNKTMNWEHYLLEQTSILGLKWLQKESFLYRKNLQACGCWSVCTSADNISARTTHENWSEGMAWSNWKIYGEKRKSAASPAVKMPPQRKQKSSLVREIAMSTWNLPKWLGDRNRTQRGELSQETFGHYQFPHGHLWARTIETQIGSMKYLTLLN